MQTQVKEQGQDDAKPASDTVPPVQNIWLGRYAKLTAIATYILVVVGSLVTTTDSGLAVPDWPLSFGQFFPPMEGGVLFEHGHRMVAGVVGLMMTGLAVWVWIADPRRWVRWFAVGAWVAVILQALLGGMTVLMKLPVAVSTAHAGLAMTFLCMTAILAYVTGRHWYEMERNELPVSTRVIRMGMITVGIIFVQIILGAVMRHMGAGLAIPDFPLAWGRLIPPLHATSVVVHFSHRVWALVVGVSITMFLLSARSLTGPLRKIRKAIHWLSILYFVQFGLGAWTIWSMKSVHVTTTHVAVGAATLVVAVLLTVRLLHARCVLSVSSRAAGNPV